MRFERLRDMREDAQATQEEIAALLHIRQNVYSRYETGYRTLPIEYLIVLADYYNTSTDYLLGRTDDPTPPKGR
nr:helix-turn-helix transcriptional regulator [Maliibacterium massiliense]